MCAYVVLSACMTMFQGMPKSPMQTKFVAHMRRAIRTCFFQYATTCMPECKRCHVRLNAPVQELEDNIKRHMNSPVMHDAVLTQYKSQLFHG